MRVGQLIFAAACCLRLAEAIPKIVEYHWNLEEHEIAPDGFKRKMFLVNGQFPGPTIEVNHNDVVRVIVRNNLDEPTSLHWHGMFQRGTPWMDGVPGMTNCPIPAQSSYTYEFNTTGNWGTYYWHSHHKGQLADGLMGPLIIHNPEEDPHVDDYDEEFEVTVSDLYHKASASVVKKLHSIPALEAVPDNILINGRGSFDCDTSIPQFKFEPGKRYRLRLINAGAISNIRFSIDNHKLTIIEADGVPMKKYTVDRLTLHVAQRYSVIVEANQTPQNYYMRAELDTQCFHGEAETLEDYPPALAEVSYNDGEDTFDGSVAAKDTMPHCADMNGESLVNYYPVAAPPYDESIVVRVRFGKNGTRLRGFLNNQTYVHDSSRPTMMNWWSGQSNINSVNFLHVINKPKVVQVVIQGGVNGGEHPFHLHGHTFMIVGTGQGTFDPKKHEANFNYHNPTRRDVAVLPRKGWIAIRFIADNPGVWALHCHMDWHLEAGLSMQFLSLPDEIMNLKIPDSTVDLCKDIRYASARHTKGELQKAAFGGQVSKGHPAIDPATSTWDDATWLEAGNVVADLRVMKKQKGA
ncbi:hypothetical protein K450DRAFT_208114 [Umbelopsis ramanniana AG]|uniref:Laccase n=1 Tax=Umbelopsis ramanniana AG TaxID=1314678 RepID=A0AAD5EBT9_UMBRA|nr:uncharacterized protein K450DRAFT_208114 [Umbelopsis ramanniana AG]KAI8581053.1 hypothetical protein K450DRAFT_208114 [Umbelopsis ramanniana AG]